MSVPEIISGPAVEQAQRDPIVTGIIFVAICVVALVSTAKPLMGLYREYKKTGADGAKSSAEQTLFEQMQRSVEANSAAIKQLREDRDRWFEEAFELKHEVERLKGFETRFDSMKKRLDEKDLIINERDREIRELTRTILQMKDRIHALEVYLAKQGVGFDDPEVRT